MKKTSGPRKHTNHNKRWVVMQWAISEGGITIEENGKTFTSYRANVDLCYCFTCKVFSYYDWHDMKYYDIAFNDEQYKEAMAKWVK